MLKKGLSRAGGPRPSCARQVSADFPVGARHGLHKTRVPMAFSSIASTALRISAVEARHAAIELNYGFGLTFGAKLRALWERVVAGAGRLRAAALGAFDLSALLRDQSLLVFVELRAPQQTDSLQMPLDDVSDFRHQ